MFLAKTLLTNSHNNLVVVLIAARLGFGHDFFLLIGNVFLFHLQTLVPFNELAQLACSDAVAVGGALGLIDHVVGHGFLISGLGRWAFLLVPHAASRKGLWACERRVPALGRWAMEILIYIGAVISVVGLVGLVVSGLRVLKAKRAGLDDDALREAVRGAMVLNFGALMLSAFGLILVIVGVILA